MQLIEKYFPNLTSDQHKSFAMLGDLYTEWNEKINVVSRKDIDNLYLHHVLHSLAITKIIDFKPGTSLLDVGTGGGFPGIPLAILFPDCKFHLIDSIGKKITVVNGVAEAIGLKNVVGQQVRVEKIRTRYDFVLSRAVTRFDKFRNLVRKNVSRTNNNEIKNGVIYLKGGDFADELEGVESKTTLYNIQDFFDEEYFETKKIIHLPL